VYLWSISFDNLRITQFERLWYSEFASSKLTSKLFKIKFELFSFVNWYDFVFCLLKKGFQFVLISSLTLGNSVCLIIK